MHLLLLLLFLVVLLGRLLVISRRFAATACPPRACTVHLKLDMLLLISLFVLFLFIGIDAAMIGSASQHRFSCCDTSRHENRVFQIHVCTTYGCLSLLLGSQLLDQRLTVLLTMLGYGV